METISSAGQALSGAYRERRTKVIFIFELKLMCIYIHKWNPCEFCKTHRKLTPCIKLGHKVRPTVITPSRALQSPTDTYSGRYFFATLCLLK